MPIYEYICSKCEHEFERIQKFSDPLETECPNCGGPVEKKISLNSFSLKGGGWYKDGYSKSSKKKSSDPVTPKTKEKKSKD